MSLSKSRHFSASGNLKEKLHYDAGSCVTIDICLEDNYTGGNIIFPEIDGTTTVVSKSQFLQKLIL